VAVTAIENYGRVYRLLKANVPVSIEMNIDAKFFGDHEHGFDTIAEIPGTDPALKDEVVMVGGHLDSWIAGRARPTTARARWWDGGHADSQRAAGEAAADDTHWAVDGRGAGTIWLGGYVKQHFGYVPLSTAPEELEKPEYLRKPAGPVVVKAEQTKFPATLMSIMAREKLWDLFAGECAEVLFLRSGWNR